MSDEDASFVALTVKTVNPGWPDGSLVFVKPPYGNFL